MREKPIVFLDTETTDLEEGRLVELAYWTIPKDSDLDLKSPIEVIRAKPPVPISFEAMAVHHITPGQVEHFPEFKSRPDYSEIKDLLENSIVVAHNAAFDIAVLEREGIEVSEFIDTKKLSQYIHPDFTSHKLQYLRYRLEAYVDQNENTAAHSAEGDVRVLAGVFSKLMALATVEQAIEISKSPVLLPRVPMGKYRGQAFSEVNRTDRGYIKWMYGKLEEWDEDLRFTVEHWVAIKSV